MLIGLIESLGNKRHALYGTMSHTHHQMIGYDVFQRIAVRQLPLGITITQSGVGGQFGISPHIGTHIGAIAQRIGDGKARRQLRQGVAHGSVVVVACHTQAEGELQLLIPPLFRGLPKSGVGQEVKAALIVVESGHPCDDAATSSAIEIVRMLHAGSDMEFEGQSPEGALESEFIFRLLRLVVEDFGHLFLIAHVLITAIVEHVATQHPSVGVLLTQHLVDGSHGVVPLVVDGEHVEHKSTVFAGVGSQVGVQARLVDRAQSNDREVAPLADAIVIFELKIMIGGQECQF